MKTNGSLNLFMIDIIYCFKIKPFLRIHIKEIVNQLIKIK